MSGVFISYRVADQPFVAAAVRDFLAGRFGAELTFRDSDSMAAGAHYPSAIRTALVAADVVVAVIGPQWMTIADPRTGSPRILCDQDWVREELATAFAKGIDVLPVLLKDTPDNATFPAPDALPEDIRRLATLQFFEFSHRRFNADLRGLADRVAELLPRRAPACGPARDDFFDNLVNALEAVPAMRQEDTRALLLGELPPPIASTVRTSPQRRTQAIHVVRACLDHDDGLAALVATLVRIEGADCPPLRRLAEAVRRLPPDFTV